MKRGSARSPGAGKKSPGGGGLSGRACDAAERSPAVYFANLKADMLLHKQMQVLRRAQNSLVHRIVIDQKILFRRFQAKLHRSKLARARLWGDKDAERQLRARDLHVMNSNCGQDNDDLDFLKKLEYRPCLVEDYGEEADGGGDSESEAPPATDRDMEDLIRAVLDEQEPPPTEKTLKSLNAIGRLLEEARLVPGSDDAARQAEVIKSADGRSRQRPKMSTVRPVITPAFRADPKEEGAATRYEQRPTRKVRAAGAREDRCSPQQRKSDSQNRSRTPQPKDDPTHSTRGAGKNHSRPRPLTSPAWSHSHSQTQSQSQAEPQKASPKASRRVVVSPVNAGRRSAMSTLTVAGAGSPRGQGSRRPSQAHTAVSSTSMFEEQRKVDVIALRLEEARSTDHAPKVAAFIRTLLELDKSERRKPLRTEAPGGGELAGEGDEKTLGGSDLHPDTDKQGEDKKDKEWRKEELKGDRKFDYYATKMALHAASVKKAPPVRLPGTPEEVNMKLVGDQTIKSITMSTITMPPPLRMRRPHPQGSWDTEGKSDQHQIQSNSGSITNILTVRHEA